MSLKFTCPKCQGHKMEEILLDATVVSECRLLSDDTLHYGEQTNDGGYIDRYQCASCGYVILDTNHCDAATDNGGIDDEMLAKVLREMNAKAKKESSEGDPVSHGELVQRIADAHEQLHGDELAGLWNEMFPNDTVRYDGDSIYKWSKDGS